MRALELNEIVQQRLSPKALGTTHIGLVEKRKNTMEPVIFDFGTAKYRVTNPVDKKWLLSVWSAYRRIGKEDKFLEMMGTLRGFEVLLDQHAIWQSRQQQQKQKQQGQAKPPKQPPLVEKASPRVQQSLDQLRKKYPQAADDSEVMLYAMLDAQKQSQQAASRIDQEADKIERNVKQAIDKKITGLSNKQIGAAAINQLKADIDQQQQIINQILKINQAQQQDLDALKGAEPTGARVAVPPPVTPAVAPAPVSVTPGALPMPVPPKTPAVSAPEPEPMDISLPVPEPEQPVTKISPPPKSVPVEPDVEPVDDKRVIPFKPRQAKLAVKPPSDDAATAGGFQKIAEMKRIQRRLLTNMKNWTKQGLL